MDAGEEISGELVVACGDGAKVLELVEEALDEVAFAIEREIAVARHLAVGLGRNHGGDVAPFEHADEGISIEGFIAQQGLRIDSFQQRFDAGQIISLSGRELHLDGIAEGVDQEVDFGRQSAARAADRLLTVFFRAPALCW
jgi:hypothetical protein